VPLQFILVHDFSLVNAEITKRLRPVRALRFQQTRVEKIRRRGGLVAHNQRRLPCRHPCPTAYRAPSTRSGHCRTLAVTRTCPAPATSTWKRQPCSAGTTCHPPGMTVHGCSAIHGSSSRATGSCCREEKPSKDHRSQRNSVPSEWREANATDYSHCPTHYPQRHNEGHKEANRDLAKP
jgi:hypothetical protein